MADIINILSGLAGVVGAVTGITSLVQVREIKSLDLRMERGRLLNALQVGMDNLQELADKANQSRVNCLAARGLSQSGPMQKWKADFEKNKDVIKGLSEKFSALKTGEVSGKKLEEQILELHFIEEQMKSLTSGLNSSLAEDDVARDQLARASFGGGGV